MQDIKLYEQNLESMALLKILAQSNESIKKDKIKPINKTFSDLDSTTSNWPYLSAFAQGNDLIYIPCAGSGYADTRIRPWNEKTTKSRDNGIYYEKMFENAVNTNPDYLGITSFNEWHEGTQIEPAIPKQILSYTCKDYGEDTDPLFYIYKTRELITKILLNNPGK